MNEKDELEFEIKLTFEEMIIVHTLATLENREVTEILREALARGIRSLADSYRKSRLAII